MTPQNWRQVTGIILVVTFAALCIYDVFAVNEANEVTISRVILSALRRWPIVAFGAGILAGHLLFPQYVK